MDAFYLGKPDSSMGIFQRNMILNLVKNPKVDELHVVTSQKHPEFVEGEKASFHLTGESFIQRGLYIAKLNKMLKPDVTFYTFNLIPPMAGKYERVRVLQNHDWSHSQFSETLKEKIQGTVYEKIHRRSAEKATVNLSNSRFTRRETLKFSAKDSLVIYHDADAVYKNKTSIQVPEELSNSVNRLEYIIYAGRVYPKYKNITTLLLAFKELLHEHKKLKLVIVHSDAFRPEDERLIQHIGSAVISLKGVTKSDLKFLYQNSICLVYPSVYEGFGSPILEAQNSGTPVVAFNGEPMTEVGGNGAIYFGDGKTEIAENVSTLIDDSLSRRNAIRKGINNAKRFSWKDTTYKTLEAIFYEN